MGCYFGLNSEDDCRGTPCRSCTANEPDASDSYSPELMQAAWDAADGNDGVNWQLLKDSCPSEMDLGTFIDHLLQFK